MIHRIRSIGALAAIASSAFLTPVHAQECNPAAVQIASQPLPSQTPSQMLAGLAKISSVPDAADVVLLGDSLLEGWGDAKDDFGGKNVWNFAVGGDRTQQLIWRLHAADLSRVKPESVVLLIGSNNLVDAGTSACSVSAGIGAIVDLAKRSWPTANLFVLPIPPRGADFRNNDKERLAVNQYIRSLSDETKKIYPIELSDDDMTCGLYSNQSGIPSKEDRCLAPDTSICPNYKADNIHFQQPGYDTIRKSLKNFSEAYFKTDVLGTILPKAGGK